MHLPLITLFFPVLHISIHASPLDKVTHSKTAGITSHLHLAYPPGILRNVTGLLRQT